MEWKSELEEHAYQRLNAIRSSLKVTGLADSSRALTHLLGMREKNGKWDWGVLEDFVNTYGLEFQQQGASYEGGFRIVLESLERTFEVKKKKGKFIDLHQARWTAEDSKHLDKTLGTLGKSFETVSNGQAAMLLLAFAIILIYETKASFAKRRLHSWLIPSVRNRTSREEIVEDFLALEGKGTDGKSDFTHLRNAFAHGHFEFADSDSVMVWDLDEKRKETYRREFARKDLSQIVSISQKKLEMLEVYPNILVAVEALYRTHKREWKYFKR